MTDCILALNAGLTQVKFALHRADQGTRRLISGVVDRTPPTPRFTATESAGRIIDDQNWVDVPSLAESVVFIVNWLSEYMQDELRLRAVTHRVAHGGPRHAAPIRITSELMKELVALEAYAPFRQHNTVEGVRIFCQMFSHVPQYACFDTAFHRTHPPTADRFGLPRALEDEGIHRYGAHGLACEYVMHRMSLLSPQRAKGRVVVLHLANETALYAIRAGRSVDGSTGFSALSGLVSDTHGGGLDPAALIHLIKHRRMPIEVVERLMYQESGLRGVSGISGDVRTLLTNATPAAREALAFYIYRIWRELGGMAAILGGLDALVFTGGIGERLAPIRGAIGDGMAWLGVSLDHQRNLLHAPILSADDSKVEVRIIPADEEWMMAHHTYQLLQVESLDAA